MVLGVGIDMTTIADFAWRDDDPAYSEAFEAHTFTAAERAEADGRGSRRAEYLAGRFAVKEAVFKAVGHLTLEGTFDLRLVETLAAPDGRPVVTLDGPLAPVLAQAGVHEVLVSITNEGPCACAIAIAQGRPAVAPAVGSGRPTERPEF